jgi:hypothetical protein
MSKVYHNVFKPFDATTITKSTTDSTTCSWLDLSGWTDKKISVECDSSGSVDVDIDLRVSSKHYYELDNEATVDTEDYEIVNIVTAHTSKNYTSFDANDVPELGTPMRSGLVTIDADDASDDVVVTLWVEGWS